MGFTLDGDTTLQQITKTLGTTPIVQKGEAGDDETSICYKAKDGFIRFLSGELGGPERQLLGVELNIQAPSDKCIPLPAAYATQDMKIGGVSLGMNKEGFIQAVGGKVTTDKSTLQHMFTYQRPMTTAEKAKIASNDDSAAFDVQITVEGQFTKGILTSLQVWKTETD